MQAPRLGEREGRPKPAMSVGLIVAPVRAPNGHARSPEARFGRSGLPYRLNAGLQGPNLHGGALLASTLPRDKWRPRALQANAIRGMCLLPQVLYHNFMCPTAGPSHRFSAVPRDPNGYGCVPPAATPLCTMRRPVALLAAVIRGVYLTLQVFRRHFMCPAAGLLHRPSAAPGAPIFTEGPAGRHPTAQEAALSGFQVTAIHGAPLCMPAALGDGYTTVTKCVSLPASPLPLLHWSRLMSEAPLSCPHFSLRPVTTSDRRRGYM
ncbi:hypothetical protein NDU88_011799 [Pleurodeles waltl]|uniref:Uncharacterized protein n=1 Tax=Pleurodeles waltl TaxID=8319 RepID=A0AAV7R423_PLEWA|nr:hypothetical protein NDU88_011799 [Pleurodeles waltl]